MTADDRIRVICNEGSGRTATKDENIAAAMRVLGDRGELRLCKGPAIEAEARQAVADGVGTVVAAGGDGTLRSVAGAVVGSGVRFGVLALGTLNHFAKAHDIPLDPEAAAGLLLSDQSRRIAVGEVNGRVFLNNVSIGLYPAMLREREDLERRWGRWRLVAHWSAVRTLLSIPRPLHLTVTTGDRSRAVVTSVVFGACSAPQLEAYGLQGAECLARDALPLLVLPVADRSGLLLDAVRLLSGALRRGRDFELVCAREITLGSRARHLSVACDGEKLRLETPLRLRLRPGALTLCAAPAGA